MVITMATAVGSSRQLNTRDAGEAMADKPPEQRAGERAQRKGTREVRGCFEDHCVAPRGPVSEGIVSTPRPDAAETRSLELVDFLVRAQLDNDVGQRPGLAEEYVPGGNLLLREEDLRMLIDAAFQQARAAHPA